VVLSFAIWIGFRGLEHGLGPSQGSGTRVADRVAA